MKTTRYFEEVVLLKRPYLRREWCEGVVRQPIRREVQDDGRIRHWGMVPELDANRVRKWAHDKTPPQFRAEMRVEVDETPRGLTILECRPPWSDLMGSEWTRAPIARITYSKQAGEWYTRHLLTRFYIVRTAWLYAPGGRNFPHRIMQIADERGKLSVVTDEVGSPTYVVDLAQAIGQLISSHQYGIYHFVNDGVCSRYDFARETLRLTGRASVPVEPTTLVAFKRDSTPPPYAPLANLAGAAIGIRLRPWQAALADFLESHADAG